MRFAIPALLVLLVFTAGCINTTNSVTTPSDTPFTSTPTNSPIETTTPTATATPTVTTESPTPEAFPNLPKPSANCTARTLPNGTYPPLPTTLSKAKAMNFALNFEKAYGWAKLADNQNTSVSGYDGWNTDSINQTDAGYVVKATVYLDFVTTGDDTLPGSTNSHGWYYVTEEFAVRAPSSSETIPAYRWETVACE